MVTAPFPPLVRWFGPPVLPADEATRRAKLLWSVAWSFFGVLSTLLIVASVLTPSTAMQRAASIVMVGALVLVLHVLNRCGRTAFASWLFVLGLTLIVTQRAWHAGGVHAPVAVFYILFILMAAGLLGLRGSFIVALACLVSATVLLGAERMGWLTPPYGPRSPAEGYIAVLLALSVTLLCLMPLLGQAEDITRGDLVNMLVHDMRSPLTMVMAHLSLLREDAPEQSESAVHADAALAATMRLTRMANNLLDIKRLEAARLPLERTPTDIAQVARSATQAVRAVDPLMHLEVRAPMPVVCECDAELMRRIIDNLVSNAIKHAAVGGHIVVEVSSASACVRVAVQDDGPGIPEAARKRIFERFSASGLRAQTGAHSVGLGLAFCQLAARAHGGRIWVEDVAPHGSRFVVEVPER